MANNTKKKIQLHPIDATGKPIEGEILYPETSIDSVKDKDGKRLNRVLDAQDAKINTKQDQLNENQMKAVNSGITAEKLEQIEIDIRDKAVQSDWLEDDSSKGSYIENRPMIPTAVSDLTNDEGYITAADVTPYLTPYIEKSTTSGFVKNDGSIDTNTYLTTVTIPITGIKVNNETITPASGVVNITIPDAQVQANWNEIDTDSKAYIQNKPALATVATTGDYDNLINTPTIPQVSIANNQITVDGTTLAYGTTGDNILVQTNSQGKLDTSVLPDVITGQMVFGGDVAFNDQDHLNLPYATLSPNAQSKLKTTESNITLTNDTTAITGYPDNEGIYYIVQSNGSFAGNSFLVGDWLVSTGSNWTKIANTDAVTGVKGSAESIYRLGNINISPADLGLGKVENKSSADIRGEITASNVETALGYTPYSEANPAGYITDEGVVKSVNGITPNAQGAISLTMPTFTQSQADWNQADDTAVDYIKNKPDSVIANTTVTPNINLTNLQVGSTVYNIPQGTYVKPNTGIPESDLDQVTQTKIDGAIQNNSTGASQIEQLGFATRTSLENRVQANVTTTDEEDSLTSLRIGTTIYKVDAGGGSGTVPATRKVAGKTLEEDTETLEDYIYEKKVETNISLLDIPNWEEFSEIDDGTWLTIYEDLNGKIIQVGNYDSAYMVEIMDTTNGSGYIITNTTNEPFTADTWYEVAGQGSLPVQTTTPDIKLDIQNVIEGYEDLFNAITSSETVTITKTLKQKLDAPIKEATYDYTEKLALLDIPNWENIIEGIGEGSSGTIYYYEGADRSIQIGCGKYDNGERYDINITDYDINTDTKRRYHIQNVTTSWSRKDVWYETVFDGKYDTDIPITTPDIPLDSQYAEGTEYGALFDSIAGDKQVNITLENKINEPLKDKVYGQLEIVKEVPNSLVDGEDYTFNANMNFSSDDIEILSQLQSGDYIYNNTDDNVSISYYFNGYSYFELTDESQNTYEYKIYDDGTWVNEWVGGTPEFYITIYKNDIENETILKRILNVGTHTEVEYKNQTLEEKNADIKNWKYEDGLKDIPDWSKFTDVHSYEEFYNDSDKIIITAAYDRRNYCYNINISDVVNTKQYIIYSENVPFGVSFEKNKWYEGILYDRETVPTQCDTPKINLSKQYVIVDAEYQDLYNNLFDAIYKTITVDDKFNSMDGLLKDKIYDKITVELVDGQSYSLTDNYDEFFEKYGNGQNTLMYGTSIILSSSGGEQIASSPKAGEETIIRIELETDSTPIIRSEKKSETKAGDGAIPAPFGASLISIVTSNYHSLYFAVNSNSWIYYNQGQQEWQNVPLEHMPKLTLDSSLIQNEEMLKDFLQLGYKEQTLGEKIEGFKDWLYETGEIKANVVYTLPSSYDYTNINEGRIYQAGITPGPTPIDPGGQLVGMSVSNGKSSLSTNEEPQENQQEEQTINTRKGGTKSLIKASSSDLGVVDAYSISVDKYSDGGQIRIQGTINGDNYSFIQYESKNGWFCNNDSNVYDNISIRISSTNVIYDEQSLKEILALKPLTLEEKINSMSSSSDEPLENKLYAHYDQVCELLEVPNWEGMGTALTGYINIYSYEHSDSGYIDNIYIGNLYDDNHYGVLMDIVSGESKNRYEIYNEDWSDTKYASGFEVKKNTWYRTVWDYESSPTTKTYTEEIPELEVQDSAVKNIDLFKCVYKYSPDTNQTLKEKFDSYKDWTYDKKDATYKLLTPDWENIDTTNTGTIYENRASIHSPSDDELNYCKYAALNEADEIETYETDEIYKLVFEKVIGFDQSEDAITETYYNFNKDCVVGYGSTQQLTKGVWYKGTYDEDLNYTVFEELNNVEMLFRDYYIKDGYKELFESLIQYIPEEITTLDEKLKYLITDYTEDSGTLTSITVKDKTTGEPIVLTVGGGKQLYQHCITFKSSNDASRLVRATLNILSNNNTPLNATTLQQLLIGRGLNTSDNVADFNGYDYVQQSGALYIYNGIYADSNGIYCRGIQVGTGAHYNDFSLTNNFNSDVVIPL